jgi:hypothetical protein
VTPERLDQAMTEVAKEQGMHGLPLLGAAPGIVKPFASGEMFALKVDPGIAAAAKALGMSEQDLKKEWPAKSLSDIARARNVDPKVVSEAIKAQRRADLDKAVADKKLSAQAAERLRSHIDMQVEMMMQGGGFKPGAGPHIFVERAVHTD